MQKFIIIILQSQIRCNNWDVSTVKNITNVSSYPIYTFKMAEEYRSFPPLFVLHSEKLWTVDVSNDTRRFEADIEASSLSATWPRIEKTYNIFWMVSENRDICIPRDTIPGMFSHRARQPTSHPEICMYCIASFVSLLIFFNSVTNDQEAGEEEEEERLFLFISWKGDPSLFDTSMRSFTGNVSIRHWTVLMRTIYTEFSIFWRMREIV